MPGDILSLAHTILHNPVEVKLAVSKPADNIRQSAYLCYEPQKLLVVKHIFEQEAPHRVIIFVGSKKKTKEIAISIIRAGFNARAMHSDLSQAERDEVMYLFRSGKIDIMVATDIVARGIDIDDIAIVINFDVPRDEEDYVHRIGRTARAGRGGKAITLVNEKDMYYFRQIERFLEKEIPKEQMPEEFGETPPYHSKQKPKRNFRCRNNHNRKGKGKDKNGKKPNR